MKPTALACLIGIACLIVSHTTDSAVYSVGLYFTAMHAILAGIICWAIERKETPHD